MSNPIELQQRMSELGGRYLQRTIAEIPEMQALLREIPTGDASLYKRIEILAHRMRGSGAMFGFDLIADATLGIEMLAVDAQRGLYSASVALLARFEAGVRLLEFAIRAVQEK